MAQSNIIIDPKRILSANPDSNTYILAPENGRTVTIKEMRSLLHWAAQTGFTNTDKVAIILEANKLGIEAQQALLKTLEEPARQTVIVLTVDQTAHLLPTTVSRCAIYPLERLAPEQLQLWRLAVNPNEEVSGGQLWSDFVQLSALEQWLWIQDAGKTKPSLPALLEQWLQEAAAITSQAAERRVYYVAALDEAIRASQAHVQPRLVLDRLLMRLAQANM